MQERRPGVRAVLLAPSLWSNLLREAVGNFRVPTVVAAADGPEASDALAASDAALALAGVQEQLCCVFFAFSCLYAFAFRIQIIYRSIAQVVVLAGMCAVYFLCITS